MEWIILLQPIQKSNDRNSIIVHKVKKEHAKAFLQQSCPAHCANLAIGGYSKSFLLLVYVASLY